LEKDTVLEMQEDGETTTVFGHTPTAYYQDSDPMRIFSYGNVIGIDCGSGVSARGRRKPFHWRLVCLRMDDMAGFYSDPS